MATIYARKNGTFQIRIVNKLLPKDLWATFDTFEAADQFAKHLEALLAQGIVPAELLKRSNPNHETWTVQRCIVEYLRQNAIPVSDIKLLDTLRPSVAQITSASLNYDWADAWVLEMKRNQNLAPSTIRHRHGALARCFDWMLRKHPEIMAQNPLRLLKRGFATYTAADITALALTGREPKFDIERDRRLAEEEREGVLEVLVARPVERTFFCLALDTAMRMRECFTLDTSQVSIPKKTVHLLKSKNGDTRQVPLPSTAVALLSDYLKDHKEEVAGRGGLLFPYWNGDRDVRVLDAATADLSRVFRMVFAAANLVDFTFHDLRHEATCRLFERTTLSDTLIAKITGHRDPRMLKRYASLRGSDLARHLW